MSRSPRSKKLVIDASIARAAGPEDATFPTSKRCRDTLIAVLKICHRVVMTDAVSAEWKRHQSRFAHTWLTQMYARRKVDVINAPEDETARSIAAKCQNSEAQGEVVRKDFHLVEAALASDKVVLALDDTVRRLLGRAATDLPDLDHLTWVNPDRPDERCIDWLEEGAPPEPARRVSRYASPAE